MSSDANTQTQVLSSDAATNTIGDDTPMRLEQANTTLEECYANLRALREEAARWKSQCDEAENEAARLRRRLEAQRQQQQPAPIIRMAERVSKRTHEPPRSGAGAAHDGGAASHTPPSKKALFPDDVAGAEERTLKEASAALAAKGGSGGKGKGGWGGGRGGAQPQGQGR